MKSIKLLSLAVFGAAVVFLTGIASTAAMAQSDTATVPAYANLQYVAPPLSVSGTQLEFGTLTVPNNVVAGAICEYDLRANVSQGSMLVRELDSSGAVVDPTVPTPSSCEATGTFAPAKFEVLCNAATPTTLTATFEDTGLAGVTFLPSNSTRMTILHRGRTGGGFANSATSTLVVTCPDGSASGSTSGAFDAFVGGRLNVDASAIAGSAVNVGTLTLSATY